MELTKDTARLVARRLNKRTKRALACTCRFWMRIIRLSNEYKRHGISDRCALVYKAGAPVVHCWKCLQSCEIQGHRPAAIHQLVVCCRCKQTYCNHYKVCLRCDCRVCRHRREFCVCWRDRCCVCKQRKKGDECGCYWRERLLMESGGKRSKFFFC